MKLIDLNEVSKRRELFYSLTRKELPNWIEPETGKGRYPYFSAPSREPVWILPALIHGTEDDLAYANRIVERYESDGMNYFNIFQSTIFPGLFAEYGSRFSPKAQEVMIHHSKMAFRTFDGAGQPDLKYHGCNDNMPTMSTKALILGGQALKDEHAYQQGVWNLNELRRLLSRAAWTSEFNSSTYSPITLSNLAKIANLAEDPKVRQIALDCEARVWAELILHWHPGTKRSGGPHSRAYQMNCVGHTHTLQSIFWLMFGKELSGYDPVETLFGNSENQVISYSGIPMHTVASFCEYFDNDFHVPEELQKLFANRKYPALTKGRAEAMSSSGAGSAEYHTVSYMEEDFSLGSVNIPMVDGGQTIQFYVTGKIKPEVKTFRDSFCVYNRYATHRIPAEGEYSSRDGFSGELNQRNFSWTYTMQKNNTLLLASIPNIQDLKDTPVSLLKMDIVFPCHFGNKINSTLQGISADVVPVSVDAGEVYLHIQPLIPTDMPRKYAVGWTKYRDYAVLELVNYEGVERTFTEAELAMIQNGFAVTVDSKCKYKSLEDFHARMKWKRILDYTLSKHRFLRVSRDDVQFELCYTPYPFGVQTHTINGRMEDEPVMQTNQLDADSLPLMSGPVELDEQFFPWGDSLAMKNYPEFLWQIGARGIPSEEPYSNRKSSLPQK